MKATHPSSNFQFEGTILQYSESNPMIDFGHIGGLEIWRGVFWDQGMMWHLSIQHGDDFFKGSSKAYVLGCSPILETVIDHSISSRAIPPLNQLTAKSPQPMVGRHILRLKKPFETGPFLKESNYSRSPGAQSTSETSPQNGLVAS